MPRCLVVTVVHHPQDARIRHREIKALLEAGWEVTYVAPWTGYGEEAETGTPGLTCVDGPRARGRDRVRPLLRVRSLLRELGPGHDVVLVHDPELVPGTAGLGLPVVWDVHEDTAAAVEVRDWIPGPLRRTAAASVRTVERWAEGRLPLLLADEQYAERFRRTHPVVPNTTEVPEHVLPARVPDEQGRHRVVYLGSITVERGAQELVDLGRELASRCGDRLVVELVGPAHGRARQIVEDAVDRGYVVWRGFVPSHQALGRVEGALAGLSLLHDEANFRPSMPTKVVEYMARVVPVVTTPLPVARALVERAGAGVLVPFGDVAAVVETLQRWVEDPEQARELGRRGHELAQRELDWRTQAPVFVAALEQAARDARA